MRTPDSEMRDGRELEAKRKEQEKEALRPTIAKGARLRNIQQSSGWQDILAYLDGLKVELAVGALWKPQHRPEIDVVAMGCAFNGGRVEQIDDLKRKLDTWIEQGMVATQQLEKLEGGK